MARLHPLCAPLVTGPATPARVPGPRAQPPAAKELRPSFSPPALPPALRKVLAKNFLFRLGARKARDDGEGGSSSSAGVRALLVPALGARAPRPELAWGGGGAGVAAALRLALPLVLRFVPGPAVPGPRREAPRPVPAAGPPRARARMNGRRTGGPGSRARPLGVALGSLERGAAGPRRSPEPKFVGIRLEVASARAAVLGRKAERAPRTGGRPSPGSETSCPSAVTRFPLVPATLPPAGPRLLCLSSVETRLGGSEGAKPVPVTEGMPGRSRGPRPVSVSLSFPS